MIFGLHRQRTPTARVATRYARKIAPWIGPTICTPTSFSTRAYLKAIAISSPAQETASATATIRNAAISRSVVWSCRGPAAVMVM